MLDSFRTTIFCIVTGVMLYTTISALDLDIFESILVIFDRFEHIEIDEAFMVLLLVMIGASWDLLALNSKYQKLNKSILHGNDLSKRDLVAATESVQSSIEEKVIEKQVSSSISKSERIRLAALKKGALFSAAEIVVENPDISRDMVRLVLRQMREEGMVERVGKGRASKWRVSEIEAN